MREFSEVVRRGGERVQRLLDEGDNLFIKRCNPVLAGLRGNDFETERTKNEELKAAASGGQSGQIGSLVHPNTFKKALD